jgi:hypothetical protein
MMCPLVCYIDTQYFTPHVSSNLSETCGVTKVKRLPEIKGAGPHGAPHP